MENHYLYQKLRDACNLLKNSDLQPILRDVLRDFDYLDYNVRVQEDVILFLYEDGSKIYLDFSDYAVLLIQYPNSSFFEKVKIDLTNIRKEIMVDQIQLEIRPHGVIVTECLKNYLKRYDTGRFELGYLDERSSVYKSNNDSDQVLSFQDTKEGLNQLFDFVDGLFLKDVFVDFRSRVRILQENEEVYVELNGEDVSYLYHDLDGRNLVGRVYDLYYGLITKRNSRDIYLLHLNKLSMDVFGLRQLKRISSKEICLVGLSVLKKPTSYYQYIEQFLKEQFHSVCKDMDNRIELLRSITAVEPILLKEKEKTLEVDVVKSEDTCKKKRILGKFLKLKRKESKDL